MGNLYWTGAADGQTFTTAGNWDTGVAPVAADVCHVLSTSNAIALGTDETALATLSLVVGGDFSGSIGTAANPLKTQTWTKITVDAPYLKGLYLSNTTATTLMEIRNTSGIADCVVIIGGTWTDVVQNGGSGVRVAGGTLTKWETALQPMSPLGLTIEGGTLTAGHFYSGKVTCNVAAGTTIIGGNCEFIHNAAGLTTTSLTLLGGWFKSYGKGAIYQTVIGRGGIFDLTRDRLPKELSDGGAVTSFYRGCRVLADNGTANITNADGALNDYGTEGAAYGTALTVTRKCGPGTAV